MKNRFIAYHEDWGRKIGSDYTAIFDLKTVRGVTRRLRAADARFLKGTWYVCHQGESLHSRLVAVVIVDRSIPV